MLACGRGAGQSGPKAHRKHNRTRQASTWPPVWAGGAPPCVVPPRARARGLSRGRGHIGGWCEWSGWRACAMEMERSLLRRGIPPCQMQHCWLTNETKGARATPRAPGWICSHTRAQRITRSRRAAQRGLAAPSRISSATIERPAPIARQGACGVQRRKSAAAECARPRKPKRLAHTAYSHPSWPTCINKEHTLAAARGAPNASNPAHEQHVEALGASRSSRRAARRTQGPQPRLPRGDYPYPLALRWQVPSRCLPPRAPWPWRWHPQSPPRGRRCAPRAPPPRAPRACSAPRSPPRGASPRRCAEGKGRRGARPDACAVCSPA